MILRCQALQAEVPVGTASVRVSPGTDADVIATVELAGSRVMIHARIKASGTEGWSESYEPIPLDQGLPTHPGRSPVPAARAL